MLVNCLQTASFRQSLLLHVAGFDLYLYPPWSAGREPYCVFPINSKCGYCSFERIISAQHSTIYIALLSHSCAVNGRRRCRIGWWLWLQLTGTLQKFTSCYKFLDERLSTILISVTVTAATVICLRNMLITTPCLIVVTSPLRRTTTSCVSEEFRWYELNTNSLIFLDSFHKWNWYRARLVNDSVIRVLETKWPHKKLRVLQRLLTEFSKIR